MHACMYACSYAYMQVCMCSNIYNQALNPFHCSFSLEAMDSPSTGARKYKSPAMRMEMLIRLVSFHPPTAAVWTVLRILNMEKTAVGGCWFLVSHF